MRTHVYLIFTKFHNNWIKIVYFFNKRTFLVESALASFTVYDIAKRPNTNKIHLTSVFLFTKSADLYRWCRTGLSHFRILRYLLSSLFSRSVPQPQAEYFLPALGDQLVKRERTRNNVKSWNGTGLMQEVGLFAMSSNLSRIKILIGCVNFAPVCM